MAMERLFQLMAEKKASDIFLVGRARRSASRSTATCMPVNQQKLDDTQHRAVCSPRCCTPEQIEELETDQRAEHRRSRSPAWAASACRRSGSAAAISAVFRYIPAEIPTLAEPQPAAGPAPTLIMEKRGLMLMVGATGSGKSTTLASMLDHRNATERRPHPHARGPDRVPLQATRNRSSTSARSAATRTASTTALRNACARRRTAS